jgi:hypothetical protein
MKTMSMLTIAGVVLLVVLRVNGIATDVGALDRMVLVLMKSVHLA